MVDVSDKVKIKWKGNWIWADYITPRLNHYADRRSEYKPLDKSEMNKFVLVRRKFFIKNDLYKAIINITADSRYKLFVNGKYIGRGINRCESYYWYYNSYDITPYLRQGENVIAIHARFYGREFAFYTPPKLPGHQKIDSGKGGVLFELELNYNIDSGCISEYVGSDTDNTKIIVNDAEKSDMPLKNDAIGYLEEFDSQKLPKNWNELDFDDSSWKKPILLNYPIKILILDENAPLFEEERFAEKIVHIKELDQEWDEEDKAEMDFNIMNAMEMDLKPLKDIKVINSETFLGKDCVCEISSQNPDKALSIFLQFGKEVVGYPRIVVEAPPGVIIDVISTEKMSNEHLDLDFLSQKRGFRLITRGGKQFFEQWDWEGFLYTQIKIRGLIGTMKIYKFSANAVHMRISKKGTFECSDPDLTKLYDSCAFTLLCCAIDGYLDCPSREQRSYLGDAYPEALIANTCFGEPRLTKKLIYDAAFGQRQDGMIFSFHPGDAEGQCHVIPDYCLYWIQITEDYIQWYGDTQVIHDLYPYFLKSIDWFWKYIDKHTGLLTDDIPYWIFIDWSYKHNKIGYNAIVNTQFMDVLYIVGKFAKIIGDTWNEKRLIAQADLMKKQIEVTFWDPQECCYRDSIKDGKFGEIISQHTNAYLAIKGVVPPEKLQLILERVFIKPGDENDIIQIDRLRDKFIKHDLMPFNPQKNVLIAQPFFMHHVNKFFDMMNRFDLMFKYFKRGWVPMIQIGATYTIWETWSKTGSECHAWAASPGYDLPTYVLGIKPIKPGFERFEITPNLADLHWANGIVPTIKGEIGVSWTLFEHQFNIKFNVPEGSICEFKCPSLNKNNKITKILVNNAEINVENPKDPRYEFILKELPPKKYEIEVQFDSI